MDQAIELLAEMMLHADQFCSKAEALSQRLPDNADLQELRLKLGQARNTLGRLQHAYNHSALETSSAAAMAEFRQLIIALLWAGYYVREHLDFRTFRMLVSVEAGFTYLLLDNRR
jgi:hypothetical protein